MLYLGSQLHACERVVLGLQVHASTVSLALQLPSIGCIRVHSNTLASVLDIGPQCPLAYCSETVFALERAARMQSTEVPVQYTQLQ